MDLHVHFTYELLDCLGVTKQFFLSNVLPTCELIISAFLQTVYEQLVFLAFLLACKEASPKCEMPKGKATG